MSAPRAACSTSRRMTRPASPVPRTLDKSTSCSSAAFRAVGVARGAFGWSRSLRRLPLRWRLLRRRNLPVRFRRGCSRLGPFASARASRLRAFARRGFLDHAQHLANLDVLSVLPRYPAQHAGLRSADLEIDLVGLELHERVTGGDHVSFVSQPFRDRARRRWILRPQARRYSKPCVGVSLSDRALAPRRRRQRRATGTLTRELCRFGVALGRWRLGRRAWPIGLLDERLLIQSMT